MHMFHDALVSFAERRVIYMKVLVIPDIHLKTWIFDRAETILKAGKADRVVCLMDMPDDWDMEFQIERYKETFDRAITFAADHPDTLWCYGNHDVSYPWGRLETGYSPYAERTVMAKLEELENSLQDPSQINIMHRIDKVLFSHGGLTTEFVKWLNEDLLDADIDEVIALFDEKLEELDRQEERYYAKGNPKNAAEFSKKISTVFDDKMIVKRGINRN